MEGEGYDKEVASSKFNASIQKSIPYLWPKWWQNGQNRYPNYDQRLKNPILWGRRYTYIAYIREYPPGGLISLWCTCSVMVNLSIVSKCGGSVAGNRWINGYYWVSSIGGSLFLGSSPKFPCVLMFPLLTTFPIIKSYINFSCSFVPQHRFMFPSPKSLQDPHFCARKVIVSHFKH